MIDQGLRSNRGMIECSACQGGVIYKDAPEERYFCRFVKSYEANVLWLYSGFGSFATKVLLCVGLGTGIEA